ncbi:MAG: septum formation initiator family protein [candidate division WOR-3 bacterium]|nr:septum formation initiator family protein [candidate division WOR-3 bacterium]
MLRGSNPYKKRLKRHIKKITITIVIFGYLFYLLVGSYGLLNITRLKRKELNLRQQKKKLIEERVALADSIKMVKNDTFLLEKIAREKLGMIMPGDTVILMDDK